MKHLILPLICLLVSTPVLSDTNGSPPTANQKVSIEDIRKIIPAEALPLITDKTLEYMKFVAETWPMLKGSEEEIENQSIGVENNSRLKTVSMPLMPGIMQTSFSFGSSQYQRIDCGFFPPIQKNTNSLNENNTLSGVTIRNVNSYEGRIFPLKIGNSEKLSYSYSEASTLNHKEFGKNNSEIEMVATVMDQINGSSSSGFPFPVNGKIWIIAFTQNNMKTVYYFYYSEELNSFISLNRSEDMLSNELIQSQKTLSFKLLN